MIAPHLLLLLLFLIIDPEEAINNDGFTLPTLRTITLGLRLGL